MNHSLILLASFNASKFLYEALNSFPHDCDVLISDDDSTDDTVEIINEYTRLNISLLSESRQGGAAKNFSYLLNNCPRDYSSYFLADQDDVWVNSKYINLKLKMEELELKHGKSMPILIFGDSTVVDSSLQVINHSFFNYESLSLEVISDFRRLVFQNIGQGATMIFNQALITKIKKVPDGIVMHDYWIMLFAKSFGIVEFSSASNILYRQHEDNAIGAKRKNVFSQIWNVISGSKKSQLHIDKVVKQAFLFKEQYHGDLNPKMDAFLDFVVNREAKSFLARKGFLISNRIYLSNLKRTLTLYYYF